MRYLRTFVLFGLIFISFVCSRGVQAVGEGQLAKAFHHKSNGGDKIMFYFTSKPTVVARDDGSFFIPCVLIDQGVLKMIENLSVVRRPWYTLKIRRACNPDGISIFFQAKEKDKQRPVRYAFFDSIGTQKGIVFHVVSLRHETGQKSTEFNKPVVVIDYGHGGIDNGAIGCHGIIEKQVTYAVGKQLARLLRAAGVSVALTRHGDQTVPLDKRTSYANYLSNGTSLFVSLHANSSPQNRTTGVETFCTDQKLFSFSEHTQHGSFQPALCHAWSCEFAQLVHAHLLDGLKKYNHETKDRGVKKSVSQVLAGTDLPAILVELGFLTNPREAWLLSQPFYQRLLAQGCCSGICAYLKKKGLLVS